MYSPEFRLMLEACRFRGCGTDVPTAREIAERDSPDWDVLVESTSFHRIGPQMVSLLGIIPGAGVPSPVTDKLKDAVQDNLVRQLRYVSEFFRIRDWLSEAGITVVPFKGFWLGEAMYGNLAARLSSDIDLFISYNDLGKVREIMTDKGYTGHASLEELTEDYIRDDLAEYNFDRNEGGVCLAHVEFHWRSSMSFYRMGITLEDLGSQVMPGVLQGRDIEVFSPAANLLLVVMHHGGKECYIQLRQVLDIAHIIRRHPDLDWEWLIPQAERFHVAGLLFLGVRLAHELTGVEVPAALAEYAGGLSDKRPGNPARGRVRLISRLAGNRIRLMGEPVCELTTYNDRLASWLFKIRSRDGLGTRAYLLKYTLMKVIAPRMVPKRWRHLFFSRKIRKSSAV